MIKLGVQVGSAVGTVQDPGTNSHKSLPGSASRHERGRLGPKCVRASGGGDLEGDLDVQCGTAGDRANCAESQERSGSSFLLHIRSGLPRGPSGKEPACPCRRHKTRGFLKNPPACAGNVRDSGSISGLGRSSEGGHDNPLQYSCLENPMDCSPWDCKESDTTERLSTHPIDLGVGGWDCPLAYATWECRARTRMLSKEVSRGGGYGVPGGAKQASLVPTPETVLCVYTTVDFFKNACSNKH